MNCFSCVPLEVLYVAIISVSSLVKVVAVFCFCFFLVNHTYRVVTFKAPFIAAVEGPTYGIVHC